MKSRKKIIWISVVAVLLLLGLYVARPFFGSGPTTYEDPAEHFKYGSVGADNLQNGLPYWIFQVLPEMFPEHFPDNGLEGWASLGFVVEKGRDVPVGFSKRRQSGVDLLGMNCAVCHATYYPETSREDPKVVLGIAHTFDFGAWLGFLFKCAADERFTVENVMAAIDKKTDLGLVEKFIYRRAIPQFKEGVAAQQAGLTSLLQLAEKTPFGPGRIDVLGPLRTVFFQQPLDPEKDNLATVDFPSIWNQGIRDGMHAHWDGNNSSLRERNISASIGVGATPDTLDFEGIGRVEEFTKALMPVAYPKDKIDESLAAQGKGYFGENCASCHAVGGKYTGKIDPLENIKTDPIRTTAPLSELTVNGKKIKLIDALNTIGHVPPPAKPWAFSHFKKDVIGYANMPLDGIWLRSPYLHNGSVPTLYHLMEDPADRPKAFSRGSILYDWKNVGWEWQKSKAEEKGEKHFDYDTSLPGNSNAGHLYGTELSREEKDAIIEYMKTL